MVRTPLLMTGRTYPLNHLAWFVLRVRKSLFATSRPLTPGRIPRSSRTMDLLPIHGIGRSMWHPAGGRDCGQQTDSGGLLTTGHASHAATLRDYLHVVRRRKWIIVQAVVLVPAAAIAFS